MRLFSIGALAIAAVAVTSAQQTPPATHGHGEVNRRGAAVMGFDQHKTVHHFYLYEDGGAIDVSIKSGSDQASLAAIRAHLPHLARLFAQGRFDAPMLVHNTEVPGTAEMANMKDRLAYEYLSTANGGRVNIVSADRDALGAVHRFLAFRSPIT